MSSKSQMHIVHFKWCNKLSNILPKIAGELQSPKGMTLNSYKPSGVMNVVFSLSASKQSRDPWKKRTWHPSNSAESRQFETEDRRLSS
ncbi:hypothetical protein AVEN_239215-1 [Araneus ventricosus]|uniref:Uncharacterized protein n=1 Tax=Araneus ventricosus TaxID=182803 RepID=A0A4Y2JL03_ARAVE|nr:hypothetical protein AVEN_239215-1 [Araneus ventricosus]